MRSGLMELTEDIDLDKREVSSRDLAEIAGADTYTTRFLGLIVTDRCFWKRSLSLKI